MVVLISIIGSTLITGSAYALLGLSFSIAFSSCRVFNFAVGQLAIVAGFVYVTDISASGGVNAIVTLAVMALFGSIVYSALLRRPDMRNEHPLILVIITLGLSEVLTNGSTLIWGGFARSADTLLSGELSIGGASFPNQGVLLLLVAVVAVLGVELLQRFTMAGQAFKAVGLSRNAARLYGINDFALQCIAWAIAFGVAGLAGVLYLPLTSVTMSFASTLGVQGFTAAIIGGVGNPSGSLLAGFGLALIYTLSALYLSSGFAFPITFGIFLLVLLVRPVGLFGDPREILGPRA